MTRAFLIAVVMLCALIIAGPTQRLIPFALSQLSMLPRVIARTIGNIVSRHCRSEQSINDGCYILKATLDRPSLI